MTRTICKNRHGECTVQFCVYHQRIPDGLEHKLNINEIKTQVARRQLSVSGIITFPTSKHQSSTEIANSLLRKS